MSREQDRDLLGFTGRPTRSSAADRLAALGGGRGAPLRQGFLHGKTFLVTTDDEGVIAGSSNFTYAGLARTTS